MTAPPAADDGMRLAYGLIALKVAVHLLLVTRYGLHGDELYFLECGRHLALGYVDHPPLVPWIAAVSEAIAGLSPITLRLPAVAAGGLAMLFCALTVRELGGRRLAQLLAGLGMLFAPAYLRMGAMLDLPVLDVCFWSAGSYLVTRILRRGERRLWLVVGAVAGVALLNKHSMLLWGVGLAAGLLFTEHRRELKSPWLWGGLGIALLLAMPNLAWQASHDWATVTFLRNMSASLRDKVTPLLFGLGQVLYMGPLATPIWMAGIAYGFTTRGAVVRPFSIAFLVVCAILLVTHGKPYYLAGAYPVLFAGGGAALERALSARAKLRTTYVSLLGASGVALAVLVLPVLPIAKVDGAFRFLFGWIVEPIDLTDDMHAQHGWRAHAEAFERAYLALPPEDRARAMLLSGTYAQAAAVNLLASDPSLPRVVSGHMSYALWGYPSGRGEILVSSEVPIEELERQFRRCEVVGRVEAPEARPRDAHPPIVVCREPVGPFAAWWPSLERYRHELIVPP